MSTRLHVHQSRQDPEEKDAKVSRYKQTCGHAHEERKRTDNNFPCLCHLVRMHFFDLVMPDSDSANEFHCV